MSSSIFPPSLSLLLVLEGKVICMAGPISPALIILPCVQRRRRREERVFYRGNQIITGHGHKALQNPKVEPLPGVFGRLLSFSYVYSFCLYDLGRERESESNDLLNLKKHFWVLQGKRKYLLLSFSGSNHVMKNCLLLYVCLS